jgi:hypothetical protein
MTIRYVGTPVLTTKDIRSSLDTVPAPARLLLNRLLDEIEEPIEDLEPPEGAGWFVSQITVRGHAGIGDTALRLDLVPTPGITVVTAPNGVGKTSVAHAARRVLADGAPSAGGTKPDNLTGARRMVRVGLVSGAREVNLTAEDDRSTIWNEDFRLSRLPTWWSTAFQRHQPLLLYPEVAMAIANPRGMHEVLKSALDLDVLTRLQNGVKEVRTAASSAEKNVRAAWRLIEGLDEAPRLAEVVGDVVIPDADQRARIYAALASDTTDWRPVSAMPPINPPPSELPPAIASAQTAASGALSGSQQLRDSLLTLADPQNEALRHSRESDQCPTCGVAGREWLAAARSTVGRLDALLAAADDTRERALQLLAQLCDAVPPAPADEGSADEVEWPELRADWSNLRSRCVATSLSGTTKEAAEQLLRDVAALKSRRDALAHKQDDERRRADGRRAQSTSTP